RGGGGGGGWGGDSGWSHGRTDGYRACTCPHDELSSKNRRRSAAGKPGSDEAQTHGQSATLLHAPSTRTRVLLKPPGRSSSTPEEPSSAPMVTAMGVQSGDSGRMKGGSIFALEVRR